VFGPGGDGAGGAEDATAHDGDAIAGAEEFGKITRDHEYGFPGYGELVDEAVDVLLGTDVDAARGFVEEEDVGVVAKEAGEGDLLLVAAGEIADALARAGGADAEAGDPLRAVAGERGWAEKAREGGEREVVFDGEVEREAFDLAIFAEETDLLAPAEERRGGAGVGADADGAVADRIEGKERAEEFAAAGTDEAGDAEDLTTAEFDGSGGGFLRAGEIADLEDGFARSADGASVEFVDLASDHELGELGGRGVGGAAGGDADAIAEDGVAIGERLHFLEEVGDVDDGFALIAEVADEGEEFFRIRLTETAGGLVEDENAAAEGEGARDFDELLFGDAEAAGGDGERDVGAAEIGEGAGGEIARGAEIEERAAVGLGAEDDVFGDAEVGRDGEFLVNGDDAGAAGVEGIARGERSAVELERAGVGRVNAGEDFHEGGFAGAVFADERVDLTGGNVEVDAGKGGGGAEAFVDLGEAQARGHGVGWKS